MSAGVSGSLVWRIVLLAVIVPIVQIAAVSQLTVFGSSADLTPLLVVAVGLLAGPMAGMLTGFGVGVFVDCALIAPIGVTAVVLVAVGYGAGRLRELRDPEHPLAPLAAGAAGTAVAVVGYSVIQFLLGIDAPVSWLLLRDMVLEIVWNSILALPVYLLVRRVLKSALPQDPRRRRRRAYTTGGLSPLSRSRP